MSFTSGYGKITKSNEQSTFSSEEILNYSFKTSLNKIQTDLKTLWYDEPNNFVPISPDQIYKNKIPNYNEIGNYLLIDPNITDDDSNPIPKVTNITVSQITQLDAISSYKLADILDTNKVRNNSNYSDLADSDYVDGANKTQIKKLSRNMFTRYIYWKNQLTGKRSLIQGGLENSETTDLNNHGTYTTNIDETTSITDGNYEPFNAMLTYEANSDGDKLSGSRIWSNIDLQIRNENSNDVKTFYEKLINLAQAIPIIHPDFKNDPNPLSKAHPFLEIYVQLPLYSTIASTNLNLGSNVNTTVNGEVIVSDNIGFTNPVLQKALGDTNNYPYKIMGFKDTSWQPQTTAYGEGNVLYFLNNAGYILVYGVGNIAHNQPLSARYPPIVSFIKYSGETLDDSFIQQMNILPDPVLFKRGDLIIETSSNVFYRLDLSNNTKEWIKVGGSNTFNDNLEVDGNINFSGTLLQNNEPFETSKWTENINNDIYRLNKVGINRENPELELDVSGNARISGRLSVADPSNNLDAVNKQYLDEIVENLGTTIDTNLVAQKGQLIKAESDVSANAEYSVAETGNLYFNTRENLYKLYYSDVNNGSWLNTEIGQISSQPPPVLDLSYNTTTSYVDLIWRNPLQLPTSLTSDISYNTEHSPAVLQHPITDKNMIYFPIINRICIKLRPIDTDGNITGNYESYQLYDSNNQKVVSSQSQVENNGWVIYRKGDKVAGQNGSSRENYVSELNPNRNLAINMPNKLRIYKVVPSEYNFNVLDISDTILPSTPPENSLSKGAEGYRVEIWLENNSLHPVNIKTIDVFYDVAPAPLEPEFVETTFKSTENVNYDNISNKNPLVSCKLEVEDPLYVSGNNDDQDELVNFTMIDFNWSVDNNNWNKFSKISLVENGIAINNILDDSGNYNINRQVDPRIISRKRYEYEFKLNNEYMTSVESTNLFSNPNRNKLYLRVGYKNGSNPNLEKYKDHELDFDTPTKPLVVDISYNNTKPDTLTTVDFTVQDPSSIIIGNNTQNIKITGIKFEWSINDTNTWYNLIKLEDINNNNNAINLNNNGIQVLNQNNNTTRKYRFDIDSNFMGSNFISLLANGLQTLKLRISYRNSAKIVFGDVEMDSLVLDRPSIPQNLVLSFNNTNNLTESKCKLEATPPTNVIIDNPYANSFTNRNNISASIKITGIKFEWGVSSTNNSDVSWNNFNRIFKGSERELSGGVWDVNLPIGDSGVLGDFFFNVNESYMTQILSLLTNNDGTKYLFTRISYRNSVKPEFSDVKISNVLIFDKPSIPQEIKLQYLLNNTDSNTLCKLDFKDPVNLLGNNTVNNSILQFTGIKYEWSINNNDWNEVQKINVSSNVVTLNNGVYDLSFNHSTSLRTYNIFITSDYLVSNINSDNDFTKLTTNISTDLYLRVSYRNSSKSELSGTITSNFLIFINPTVPRNITLDYMETDSNSITKYNMVITDPSYILSYYNDIDASNVNAIVKITDIELEWSINGSSWNDFINIVENSFNSNNLNNLASGLYSRTRLLTNSNTAYIFDLSDNYMNNILTLVYNGLSNNQLPYPLYTKTAYRNSATTRLSPDLSSNVLYFDRPSEPRLVSIEYNNTTTSKVSRVKLTVLDPSNVINVYNDSYNNIIKYTGLKMEWDTNSNFTNPKNLLLIEDGSNQGMTSGIYTTLKAHSNSNRTFYFEMSDNFMSDFNTDVFTNNDATDIYLRVSHRNSTLSNFSNFTTSNLLKSDVPSVPDSVLLTYDSVVAGIQRLNIAVKDPLNTVNYYGTAVNTKVNMTNIKFEWSVDNSKWNLFNNMIVSEGTISKGVNAINRIRDNTIRNYKFDLTSTYLANDDVSLNQLLLNGGNLYVRVSYQNSTKNSFSETTVSNIIYLTPPTEPRIVSLDYFQLTHNDKTTRCKIEVKDPSFVISYYDDINSDNVNNLVKYDGYKFEWATEPDGVSANWATLEQIVDTNDALNTTTKTSLDSNGILSSLKTHRDSSRTFYFDLSSNDLNGDVNDLVLNKSKDISTNIYVRLSYRNTVVDTFSGTTQSNEIVSDVPSAPYSVVLTYDSVNNDVQRLNIAVVDPLNTVNHYGSGKNNLVNMTNIKFEWSTDNTEWQLFNNMIDPSNNVLSNVNGVYNINRIRDSTTRNYKFDLTSTYLANDDASLNQLLLNGGNLYVRVSYQNSTKSAYGNEKHSLNLEFNKPAIARDVSLNFFSTTNSTMTKCKITVLDPSQIIQGYDDLNTEIKIRNIKFEWKTNHLSSTWRIINRLDSNTTGTELNNYSSGIYNNVRNISNTSTDYYLDINSTYLGSNVSEILDNDSNVILEVRVSYMNTIGNYYSDDKISNSITFDITSDPRENIINYISSNAITRASMSIKDPENILINQSSITSLRITGIKFEWRLNNSNWNTFKKLDISGGSTSTLTLNSGVYDIVRNLSNTNVIYNFDINNYYLGENIDGSLNVNATTIETRVSYKNSAQNRFSQLLESNLIHLTSPTEPRIVSLDYFQLTHNDKTTRCKIEVKDPSFVISYYDDINSNNVNNLIKFDGYKFEWATEPDGVLANWTTLKRVIDNSGNNLNKTVITNGIYESLKSHSDTNRVYYFDLSSNDLNGDVDNFVLGRNEDISTNIYVRLSYRNTVVDQFSNSKESNLIVSDVPSAPRSVALTYDSVNIGVQKLNIAVVDPSNAVNHYGTIKNTLVNMTSIKFEWSINDTSWNNFSKIEIPTVTTLTNGEYGINRLINNNTANYRFVLNTDYMGNNGLNLADFNTLKETNGGKLYIRVSYQNSTKSAYGNITKSDITLTKPSAPRTVTLTLNSNTTTSVTTSRTVCNLLVIDPEFIVNDNTNDNTKINIKGIKFEWKYSSDIEWKNFNQIKSGSVLTTNNGILTQNRIIDNSDRNYTFELNSTYLNSYTVPTDTTTLIVRVSYENTAVNIYSDTTSSSIKYAKPSIHSILDVNMNTSTTILIRIPAISSDNKINGDTGTSTNYNAIFIKQVEILPKRKLDNDSYENLQPIVYDYSGNTSNGAISSYIYTIPAGLLGTTKITALEDYRFAFSVRLKNNIVDQWSEYSVTNTDTTNNNAENLYISQITTDNTVNNISQSNQDEINVNWTQPASLERGVLKAGNNVPIVYDYSVNVYDPDYSTVITTFKNTTSSRTIDATNSKTNVVISNILQVKANNNNNNAIKNINIDVWQRNEYITNPSKISKIYYYILTKPNNPVINTSTSSIVNAINTVNSITYKWTKPTEPGLSVGYTSPPTNYSSLAINRYEVVITANRSGSNSPLYRNLTNLDNDPSFTIIVNASETLDANTYLSTSSSIGVITKNSIFTTNRTTIGVVGNVLIYPDTIYNFLIKARNRYGILNDGLETTISTSNPSANVNLFTNTTLPITTALTTNLSSNTTKYTNKGFIRGDETKTSVSIINASSLTANISATAVTARMNLVKLNSLITPENININDISNINVRQYRIINVGNNNEVIYKFGLDGNIYDISLGTNGTYGITSITSSARQDLFSRNNYDAHNRGYWWMESVGYNINFSNKNSNLYGKPVRLNLSVRYNEIANQSNASLENDNNVIIYNRDILTDNIVGNNGNAYFDNLKGNPTITDISLNEITNTNKINGLPNLYPILGKSYTFRMKYLLNNYSEYYELQSDLNVSSLDLSGAVLRKNDIKSFNFNNYTNILFDISRGTNNWNVSALPFTNTDVGTNNVLDKEVKINIKATNTFGTASTYSSVLTFINDASSVIKLSSVLNASSAITVSSNITLPTDKGQLMKVPNGFKPHEPLWALNTNENNNRLLSSSNVDEVFNNYETYNSYQLHMYNGYYGSTEWLRQQLGGTLSSLKTKYNLPTLATEADVSYSYSIFKFVRRNLKPATLTYNLFVLSLGSDNNLTYDDFNNDNVKVMIQVYNRDINTPTNLTLIDYNRNGAETSLQGTTYNWTIYKPRAAATSGATTGNVSLLGETAGLGTNSIGTTNSSEFDTGKSNLPTRASILNNTYYDFNGNKALIGFYKNQSLANQTAQNARELVFYVAVGLKNNTNKYFKEIQSFDIYTNTNSISRPT